jgi:hypothetical protein
MCYLLKHKSLSARRLRDWSASLEIVDMVTATLHGTLTMAGKMTWVALKMTWVAFTAIGVLVAAACLPAGAAELIMLEEDGCPWCERWNEEVGVVYSKTPEGKRAPLRRLDIHEPLPKKLKFLVKGGYTPTFVLVDRGREVGRIRGYPGEDFFWGLLARMLKRLPPTGNNPVKVN